MKTGTTRKGWTLKYTALVRPTPGVEDKTRAPKFDAEENKFMPLGPRLHLSRAGKLWPTATVYCTPAGVAKHGEGIELRDRGL